MIIWWIAVQKHFYLEYNFFCNIINIFTDTFSHFKASLQNKSINKKSYDPTIWNGSVCVFYAPLPLSNSVLTEQRVTVPPVEPWRDGRQSSVCRARTSSNCFIHTTHCSNSRETHTHSSWNCTERKRVKHTLHQFYRCRKKTHTDTLLSASLVMAFLATRWATRAASSAEAALSDWTHAVRTCCHQGETHWPSHDSSTAPDTHTIEILIYMIKYREHKVSLSSRWC